MNVQSTGGKISFVQWKLCVWLPIYFHINQSKLWNCKQQLRLFKWLVSENVNSYYNEAELTYNPTTDTLPCRRKRWKPPVLVLHTLAAQNWVINSVDSEDIVQSDIVYPTLETKAIWLGCTVPHSSENRACKHASGRVNQEIITSFVPN